jgi:hypothetical protein
MSKDEVKIGAILRVVNPYRSYCSRKYDLKQGIYDVVDITSYALIGGPWVYIRKLSSKQRKVIGGKHGMSMEWILENCEVEK